MTSIITGRITTTRTEAVFAVAALALATLAIWLAVAPPGGGASGYITYPAPALHTNFVPWPRLQADIQIATCTQEGAGHANARGICVALYRCLEAHETAQQADTTNVNPTPYVQAVRDWCMGGGA